MHDCHRVDARVLMGFHGQLAGPRPLGLKLSVYCSHARLDQAVPSQDAEKQRAIKNARASHLAF